MGQPEFLMNCIWLLLCAPNTIASTPSKTTKFHFRHSTKLILIGKSVSPIQTSQFLSLIRIGPIHIRLTDWPIRNDFFKIYICKQINYYIKLIVTKFIIQIYICIKYALVILLLYTVIFIIL